MQVNVDIFFQMGKIVDQNFIFTTDVVKIIFAENQNQMI